MRALRVALLGTILVGMPLGACVLGAGFTTPPGGDGGNPADGAINPPTPTDAAGTDSGNVQDSGAGVSGQLLTNGDMELGCAGWFTYNMTLAEDPDAHGGSRSCRICAGSGGAIEFSQTIDLPAPSLGQRYLGAGWLALASDAGPPPGYVLQVDILDTSSNVISSGIPTPGPGLSSTWQRLSALNTVVDGGAKAVLRVRASSNTGNECMLVDDMLLQRIE